MHCIPGFAVSCIELAIRSDHFTVISQKKGVKSVRGCPNTLGTNPCRPISMFYDVCTVLGAIATMYRSVKGPPYRPLRLADTLVVNFDFPGHQALPASLQYPATQIHLVFSHCWRRSFVPRYGGGAAPRLPFFG